MKLEAGTTSEHPRFEVFEHTADAGIIAHARDIPGLFSNAALGLFSLMVDLAGVRERESREIQVDAHDLDSLLVRWLTELLYYLDAEEMLFSRFEISEMTETSLRATAHGERVDRDRHDLRFGVKAVTRHMLEIARKDGGYRARVLFDI